MQILQLIREGCNNKIIPSQMEVAPPHTHRTVDIRQKRRLFKNTKETEKILEG